MGLKCRLLGHTYGETEVQRTREEQGDEVVVTIRELKVCERCGAEQTVSQNKEVTAIRTPGEVGLGGPDADGAAQSAEPDARSSAPASSDSEQSAVESTSSGDSEAATEPVDADVIEDGDASDSPPAASAEGAPTAADEGVAGEADADEAPIEEAESTSDGWETGSDDFEDVEADPDGDDAVILEGTESERDETQWPEETETDPASAAEQSQAAENGELPDDEPDAEVTNDAEIIDGDEEEPPRERGHGEWPEREDGPEPDGWPDHEGEDEGFDAATNVDDEDVELGGSGLTPEVNGRADLDADDSVQGVAAEGDAGASSATQSGQSAGDEGFARARSSTTLESDVPDDRVEFYCPNCGYVREAGVSSMRAGDICPECRKGYIAERER
ncbi:DUF7093 family protein [Halobellus rufus]|uniref:DUF7093 family protein n=1 Tax=Halobellus rufus TaxID=1448860 RepID=UPI00067900DC|nr:hypothetical protein [Halobellus rufus]